MSGSIINNDNNNHPSRQPVKTPTSHEPQPADSALSQREQDKCTRMSTRQGPTRRQAHTPTRADITPTHTPLLEEMEGAGRKGKRKRGEAPVEEAAAAAASSSPEAPAPTKRGRVEEEEEEGESAAADPPVVPDTADDSSTAMDVDVPNGGASSSTAIVPAASTAIDTPAGGKNGDKREAKRKKKDGGHKPAPAA